MSEIKVMNDDEIRDFCIKRDLKIFVLEREIERLNNIINKAVEYINKHTNNGIFELRSDTNEIEELLEILKGDNKE